MAQIEIDKIKELAKTYGNWVSYLVGELEYWMPETMGELTEQRMVEFQSKHDLRLSELERDYPPNKAAEMVRNEITQSIRQSRRCLSEDEASALWNLKRCGVTSDKITQMLDDQKKKAAYISELDQLGPLVTRMRQMPKNDSQNERQDEILTKLEKAWKTLDTDIIEPYLDENIQYNSAWLDDEISGKTAYLKYLSEMFDNLLNDGKIPEVEVVKDLNTPYVQITQTNKSKVVLDYEVRNNKICKMLMRPSVKIVAVGREWEYFDKPYYRFLGNATKIAGYAITDYIKKLDLGEMEFSWIQTRYHHPGFQHLCFRLGNDVYSIIIGMNGFADNKGKPIDEIIIPEQIYRNQLAESKKHNLIPCVCPIYTIPQLSLSDGAYLIHTETHEKIYLKKPTSKNKVPMSVWEVHDMGISIVLQYLEKEGYDIYGYCNVIDIFPQIKFKDKDGKEAYVVVNTISENTKGYFAEKKLNHQFIMTFADHNGYYAKVGIFPSSVSYDGDGNLVPLSKCFNQDDPKGMLYRGDGFYIKFDGLIDIEKVAAKRGTSDKPIYHI